MRIGRSYLAVAVTVSAVATAARAAGGPDGARWWSHVRVLADDALEGRDTGSPGHRKAAEYVAGEFAKLGPRARRDRRLPPAGRRSCPATIDEAHSASRWCGRRAPRPLDARRGRRDLASASTRRPSRRGRLVFAGYGLSIPEAGSRRLPRPGRPRQAGRLPLRAPRRRSPAARRRTCSRRRERSRALRRAGARSAPSRSRTPSTWTSPGSASRWRGSCPR